MMDRLRGVLKQLRALFHRRAAKRELEDELTFHVEMATAENERLGMSTEKARRRALISFGGLERYAERVSEVRWIRWLEDLSADVRYGARMLGRRPGFTMAVVATLGLGIGGTTAIFSVVDGLFLRVPEGVAAGSTMRRIYIVRDEGSIQTPRGGPGSWVDYEAMRAGGPAFSEVAAYIGPQLVDLGRGAEAEQVRAILVSDGYLEMLGIRPALGRLFVKEEDATLGAHPVALISHAMWQREFGGAADVIGLSLLLNGERVEIVGVAQKGFTDLHLDPVDVWLPSALASDMGLILGGAWRTSTGMAAISYVGRLAPGASEEAALAQSTAALRHAAEAEPLLDSTPEVRTTSLALASSPGGNGAESVSLWLVLVAGLVLIIACANVVNLLLTRAITRRRELSVRLALGAGRWRVARQHLTESLMLALLGGAAGVALAYAGVRLLLGQFPLPRTAGEVDARLLLFALLVSLLTGLLFGVFPAVRSVQLDPVQGLRDTRAAGSIARSRTRRALVVVQVSLSLALLVGAGLFVRSLREVNAIDGGVDLDRLLTASVDLRRAGYSEAEREAFYARALAQLSSLPSVERAAIVHFEPFNSSGMSVRWDVPGREAPDGTEGPYLNMAGVGYFETAGTRLLAGRTFDETDRSGGEPVAVLNEAMALLMADDGNMVGRCVPLGDQVGGSGCTRIVGIVETQRRRYLDDKPVPVVFLSRTQAPNAITWGGPTLLVRTRGKPVRHAAIVRAAVQGLSEGLPYVKVQPLEELIRRDVLPYRLGARLFSLFGLLALALAALGLYGVLSYFVMERTAEIGIRRSLGAPAGGVIALVIRQGMIPVTVGVLAGMAAAFAGTRFLSALLFGVDARDPLVFTASAAFLLVVALIASLVPAVRAARVSPMVALRMD